MSGKVVGWAMEQETGSPTTKLVLVKLADNAGEDGLCWPSIEKIVAHTELGQSTVYKHLSALEEAGLISPVEVERNAGTVRGYQLHIAGAIPPRRNDDVSIPRGGKLPPPDGKAALPRGKNVPPRGMPYKEEPSLEPSEEPSLNPRGAARSGDEMASDSPGKKKRRYSDPFERIWTEMLKWPGFRREIWSKAETYAAFQEIEAELPGTGIVVDRAREYGRFLERENARRPVHDPFRTMHPANWLRNRRWDIEDASQGDADAAPPVDVSPIPEADLAILRSAGINDADIAAYFADGAFQRHGPDLPPHAFQASRPFKQKIIRERWREKLSHAIGVMVFEIAVRQEHAA